jgi:hypothetical protein
MARPQLDHFLEREVEKTSETKDGYKIYLEGGVVIHSTRQLPDGLKGQKLTTVLFSEDETTMVFDGGSRVSLHPTNYMMETDEYKPMHPQTPEELDPSESGVPEDPSAERIKDGPEAPESDSDETDEAEAAQALREAHDAGEGE